MIEIEKRRRKETPHPRQLFRLKKKRNAKRKEEKKEKRTSKLEIVV